MPATPHPLQTALDRATTATYTVIDLLDIARTRKPAGAGREGRTDARQASLYKAIVASCVAALEETFEAFAEAGLRSLGTPAPALSRISTAISKGMQSPNPQNLDNLLCDYLGFKPSEHWSAHLAHSPAAYRRSNLADQTLDHRLIYTANTGFRAFERDALSSTLSRFVRIRNSFAHQDTSTAIFSKAELSLLRTLRKRKAASEPEIEFVESVSATCAVTLDRNAPESENPLIRWTLHEVHAVNVLLLYLGLVASTGNALADHLETTGGIRVSDYDRLVFRVQKGRWCDWDRSHEFSHTNVDFQLIEYKPSSR